MIQINKDDFKDIIIDLHSVTSILNPYYTIKFIDTNKFYSIITPLVDLSPTPQRYSQFHLDPSVLLLMHPGEANYFIYEASSYTSDPSLLTLIWNDTYKCISNQTYVQKYVYESSIAAKYVYGENTTYDPSSSLIIQNPPITLDFRGDVWTYTYRNDPSTAYLFLYEAIQDASISAIITGNPNLATNASVNLAFLTNASLGMVGVYDLTPYATNVSVNNAFLTNASLGYTNPNAATNSSVNLALNQKLDITTIGTTYLSNASVNWISTIDFNQFLYANTLKEKVLGIYDNKVLSSHNFAEYMMYVLNTSLGKYNAAGITLMSGQNGYSPITQPTVQIYAQSDVSLARNNMITLIPEYGIVEKRLDYSNSTNQFIGNASTFNQYTLINKGYVDNVNASVNLALFSNASLGYTNPNFTTNASVNLALLSNASLGLAFSQYTNVSLGLAFSSFANASLGLAFDRYTNVSLGYVNSDLTTNTSVNSALMHKLNNTTDTFTGLLTLNGSFNIIGNLYVNGSSYSVSFTNLDTSAENITLRSGATLKISDGSISGLKLIKADGVHNLLLGAGNDAVMRVGWEGQALVKLAARADTMTNNWYAIWDDASAIFRSSDLKGYVDGSISVFATNSSVNQAFLTNASLGYTNPNFTTNSSVNSALFTNASLGLAFSQYTNASLGLAFSQYANASLGLAFSQYTNVSLGYVNSDLTTNSSVNLAFMTNASLGYTNPNAASNASVNSGLTIQTQKWIDINRCGFRQNTDVSLAFNPSTYVLSMYRTGSTWTYFRQGIEYTFATDPSIQIANPPSKGTYFVVIDNVNGNLSVSNTPWTLLDSNLPVCSIAWDASSSPIYEMALERHQSLIDTRMHYYLHNTMHTQYLNGGAISGYTLNASSNATNVFAISQTQIADEDLNITIPALAQPDGSSLAYTCFYRTNASTWQWRDSSVPYLVGPNNRIYWDSNGVLTEAANTNSRWYNWYLLYTNIAGRAGFAFIPGRGIFTTLVLAESEDPRLFDMTGLPIQEYIIAYQIPWRLVTTLNTQGHVSISDDPQKIYTAFLPTVTNTTTGLTRIQIDASYATNASVNTAFITNVSLGLVGIYDLSPYSTNVSTNLAFATNVSLGTVFNKVNYINDPSLNQYLFKWNNGLLEPSKAYFISILSDVNLNLPVAYNQVLAYDTSVWKNKSIVDSSLWNVVNASDYFWIFSDVSLTSPADNQALVYNAAKSIFVNKTINASMYNVDDASNYFYSKSNIDASFATYAKIDASYATNASIGLAFASNASLGLAGVVGLTRLQIDASYATNASVNNAFLTNSSIGINSALVQIMNTSIGINTLLLSSINSSFASNASVNSAFLTNASLGLAFSRFTNASLGLSFSRFTNVSLGLAFNQYSNASLGLAGGGGGLTRIQIDASYATNASVNTAFYTNASLGLAGGQGGLTRLQIDASYATNASINNAFLTNTSLGLVGTGGSGLSRIQIDASYATNASVGLAFLTNTSLGLAGIGVTSLQALTDVSISSLALNQVLAYDISIWKNKAVVDISLWNVVNASDYFWIFSDVSLTSPSNSQALVYDAISAKFVNRTINASAYSVDDASNYFYSKSSIDASFATNASVNNAFITNVSLGLVGTGGSGLTRPQIDASFATNASVNNAFITNASLGKVGIYDLTPYATNASVNLAFYSNASLGLVGTGGSGLSRLQIDASYATNASVNNAFITNASLGLILGRSNIDASYVTNASFGLWHYSDISLGLAFSRFTNVSLGLAFSRFTNVSLGLAFNQYTNASLGLILGRSNIDASYATNASVGLAFTTNVSLGLINNVNASLNDQYLLISYVNSSTYYEASIGNRQPFIGKASPGSGSSGTQGQWAFDNTFLYICISTNTWGRASLATGY